jgi:CheY-like chemotaxis protein
VSATEHALVPAARVLVVDDERKNRQLLEVMLGAAGHVVVTAECGADALTLAARERPDLILLDVMMPGMDGYQVAGRLTFRSCCPPRSTTGTRKRTGSPREPTRSSPSR